MFDKVYYMFCVCVCDAFIKLFRCVAEIKLNVQSEEVK